MLSANSFVSPIPLTSKFTVPGYYVWGSTVVKAEDGLYHMIFSMWEEQYGYDAWMTHSKFGYAVSAKAAGPYEYKGILLEGRGGDAFDADNLHNECLLYDNGTYYLYYTGARGNGEFWDNRNHQRCGVMMAKHPAGPWKRLPHPIMDVKDGNFTTGVPNVIKMHDSRYLMVYKTVTPGPLPFGGGVVHKVAVAESPLGPFVDKERPFMEMPGANFPIDDHTEWYEDGKYYAIVKDNQNKIYNHGTGLLLFESDDAFDWKLAPEPFLMGLKLHWADGTTEEYSRLEMPKLVFDNGKIVALTLAARPLDESKLSFNIQLEIH